MQICKNVNEFFKHNPDLIPPTFTLEVKNIYHTKESAEKNEKKDDIKNFGPITGKGPIVATNGEQQMPPAFAMAVVNWITKMYTNGMVDSRGAVVAKKTQLLTKRGIVKTFKQRLRSLAEPAPLPRTDNMPIAAPSPTTSRKQSSTSDLLGAVFPENPGPKREATPTSTSTSTYKSPPAP